MPRLEQEPRQHSPRDWYGYEAGSLLHGASWMTTR
jgi:hypothetical protein